MADAKKNEDDPSIEEILDSIRRIISDDDVAEDAAAAAPEPEPEPKPSQPEPEPEPVKAVPKPPSPPPPPPPSAPPEPEFEPEPEPESEPEEQPEEEVLVLTERAEPEEPPPADSIVDEMEAVVDEAISKQPLQVDLRDALEDKPEVQEMPVDHDSVLSHHAEEEAYHAISELARKVAMGRNTLTLEDIVRQELKPLLRGWLDDHLSSVIDRLVREELERVSNRVLED